MSDLGRDHSVPTWRLNALRLFYLLIAGVMGSAVWTQLLTESHDWIIWKGIGKSMLAGLALLAVLGVFHPLKMLPLMIFELAWKSIWLLVIALPAWAGDRLTPHIEGMFWECIGVVILLFVIPWHHVWRRYVAGSVEPWRMGGWSRLSSRSADKTGRL